MQFNVKKRVIYGAIVFIWVFLPVYLIINTYLSSEIIDGTCIPWGGHNYAVASIILITYQLPLMTVLFCYTRIVYKLKRKVTRTL